MMSRCWVNVRREFHQWLVLVWMGGILFSMPVLADQADETYTLSIVPQYTPLFIHRNWRPFAERLQQETGASIRVKTYVNFQEFLMALEKGEPDFTYLAPYHLVLARKAQGYEPLVRGDAQKLVGLVVVEKDNAIGDIAELQGKTIVFPSRNAFAASLYLRAWLHEKLGLSFISRYAGTHDNVYRHVVMGIADAGGGVNSTLESQPASLKQNLRVLYELPGVAAHPLAAHPRVPLELRNKLANSVLQMQTDTQGMALLEVLHMEQPVLADYRRDYSMLESLDLEKYRSTEQE